MTQLAVTQVKSSISCKPKHRGTLRALGLGRIGKRNVLPDRPEIRGMIAKVPHLVAVTETDEVAVPARRSGPSQAGAPETNEPDSNDQDRSAP